MKQDETVWVFLAVGAKFPAAVFSSRGKAETWISERKLSGTLTEYPVDESCLDWAVRNNLTGMKPEKLEAKRRDPSFIGSFTTASQAHYHYENGMR